MRCEDLAHRGVPPHPVSSTSSQPRAKGPTSRTKLGLKIWLNSIQEVGNKAYHDVVAQQDLRPVLGGNVFLHRADERLDLSEGFAVCEPRPNLRQNALDFGAAINDEEPFRKPGS